MMGAIEEADTDTHWNVFRIDLKAPPPNKMVSNQNCLMNFGNMYIKLMLSFFCDIIMDGIIQNAESCSKQAVLCFFFCGRPWLQLTLVVSRCHSYSSLQMEVPSYSFLIYFKTQVSILSNSVFSSCIVVLLFFVFWGIRSLYTHNHGV